MKNLFTVLATLCVALTFSTPALALSDELECYKAKDVGVVLNVDLTFINDQAILENRGCGIINGKLRRVCLPADVLVNTLVVNGSPATENPVEGPELAVWYACYSVRCADKIDAPNVMVMNRLADSETKLIATRPSEVCFPFEP